MSTDSIDKYNGWSLLQMRITCFQKLIENQKQVHMNGTKLSDAYDSKNIVEYQRLLALNDALRKEYFDIYSKCENDMKP